MRSILRFVLPFLLFVLLPAVGKAAQAKLVVTFDPPADVLGETGVEYTVEIPGANGTWVEVAKGAGDPVAATPGKLAIAYSQKISFGVYSARVVVSKPTRGPPSDVATVTIAPGKPGNVKVEKR